MTQGEELDRRREMWGRLMDAGGPSGVRAQLLRELGIYGGAQGCWVDKDRTREVAPSGVTVGLLHTGSVYPDDLSEDGVLYHYPVTGRPAGRDASEVQATKAAGELKLPVFVVTKPTPSSNVRNVHLGWIEGWDDAAQMFLVTFSKEPPALLVGAHAEDSPFELEEKAAQTKTTNVKARPGQSRFKLQVFQYYEARCAVCDISVPRLLDAAHIRSKKENGSDDPRNGLVLCASHHRAMDADLFGVDPKTLKLVFKSGGPDQQALAISRSDLLHLSRKPHPLALEYAWKRAAWE